MNIIRARYANHKPMNVDDCKERTPNATCETLMKYRGMCWSRPWIWHLEALFCVSLQTHKPGFYPSVAWLADQACPSSLSGPPPCAHKGTGSIKAQWFCRKAKVRISNVKTGTSYNWPMGESHARAHADALHLVTSTAWTPQGHNYWVISMVEVWLSENSNARKKIIASAQTFPGRSRTNYTSYNKIIPPFSKKAC